MNANPHDSGTRQASQEASSTLRIGMEATARALFAADNAHVHEAMNSVQWERRGLLQRLTRTAPQ
ncbi:MAG: hypothetical protein M3O90_04405 [Actinomycetota bacterium]|nr:hypothetical protein [Actinomycetota bacterium]